MTPLPAARRDVFVLPHRRVVRGFFDFSRLNPSYKRVSGTSKNRVRIDVENAHCKLQTAKIAQFAVKSAKVENPDKLQDKTAKCSSDFFAVQIVWEPDFFALCVQLFAVQRTSNVFVFSLQTSCASALRVHSNWFRALTGRQKLKGYSTHWESGFSRGACALRVHSN